MHRNVKHLVPVVIAAVGLLATPLAAETRVVEPGEGAQERLQEALIVSQPGDEIVLGAGRFELTDGLSLDVDGVTVRGAGMDGTVLDFSGQEGSGEGLLVTSDNVILRDFALENPKGDGIKSKGADNIVYYRIRVEWTGGPKTTNGAYGIYPVSSTGVLVDGCKVSGASDAGIYVGQSKAITVRYNFVENNVAGIEIENSRDALVEHNLVTRNTGGILVFDLPNLPFMGGGNTLITSNTVVGNDTPNFAPKGNIVAGVPRGTGVMVMANEQVEVTANTLADNPTAHVMIVAYPQAFTDKAYNPYPRDVRVIYNLFRGGGDDPQLPGGKQLAQAFGGALPPVIWDGLGKAPRANALDDKGLTALNLGLTKQGADPATAKPAPLILAAYVPEPIAVPAGEKPIGPPRPGAPAALDARARP